MRSRIVICARKSLPSMFSDDVFGTCVLCEAAVRHRPHIPERHVLICLVCYFKHAEPGPHHVEILGEAVNELRLIGLPVPARPQ